MNETGTLASLSSVFRSAFYCPNLPQFIWDLNDTTSIKIALAITITACPFAIILNILVIIAVKTRRELQRNSNILLSSLAVIDFLVGAVSMPLAIAFDSFILQRFLREEIICTCFSLNDGVLYTTYCASFYHLVLIAWERCVAIRKCMEYKDIVTRERVVKYAKVAWLLAILTVPPAFLIRSRIGARYFTLVKVVNVILGIAWGVSFLLLGIFYVKTYLGVRKWNRTRIQQVNVLVKARLETKIAYTTFWLLLFAAFSGIPAVILAVLWGVSPSFRKLSLFRWTETVVHLNSLANPILYYYRNRRFRKTALELMRFRKPQRIQPAACTIRRRRYSVASIDVEDFQNEEQRPRRLIRSESCHAVMCSDKVQRKSHPTRKERSTSATSSVTISEVFTQQRSNKQVVTVPIENTPRRKPPVHDNSELPNTMALKKQSRHNILNKTVRSSSLSSDQNTTKKEVRRSKSVPI